MNAPYSILAEFYDRLGTHPDYDAYADFVLKTTKEKGAYCDGITLDLACGTGACASVAAAVAKGYCLANTPVTVLLDGGALTVIHSPSGTTHMIGGAEFAFDGVVEG